ncbi:hypothetical protein CYPRO_0781 [Cyclonatronum proteinivorum]|uniref:Uncharacterized protein n=1 Tax=Cyclonatronum proteinivorum TaxID=1457365 RepID=A0A345UHW2_9BACT|nr:hypothetical protein CYPRO_0781 [Cyclonatronum proteinivorum]
MAIRLTAMMLNLPGNQLRRGDIFVEITNEHQTHSPKK